MEEGGDSEIGLGSWFFRPLPMLHTLCFNDERLNLPYPSFLSLLSYNLPSLHSLYLPNTSLSVIGGPFTNLSSLGILAWDPDTLTSLAHVLSNTRSLLHLTLYANAGQVMGLDDYTPPPIQPLDSLLSLRLTGYSGSDVENIHFILELFAAPNLQTLELVNCELRILSELATQQVCSFSPSTSLIVTEIDEKKIALRCAGRRRAHHVAAVLV
ncbi:hypothetical protein DL93DRAFT_2088927 [Clavulina sp. PMI_390]|nr:hypothetical protein DL93DRAFT_2088927 [Clavulina sp. PMI_390]